jgi:hypothetical protein
LKYYLNTPTPYDKYILYTNYYWQVRNNSSQQEISFPQLWLTHLLIMKHLCISTLLSSPLNFKWCTVWRNDICRIPTEPFRSQCDIPWVSFPFCSKDRRFTLRCRGPDGGNKLDYWATTWRITDPKDHRISRGWTGNKIVCAKSLRIQN